jgi:hypothetical protein
MATMGGSTAPNGTHAALSAPVMGADVLSMGQAKRAVAKGTSDDATHSFDGLRAFPRQLPYVPAESVAQSARQPVPDTHSPQSTCKRMVASDGVLASLPRPVLCRPQGNSGAAGRTRRCNALLERDVRRVRVDGTPTVQPALGRALGCRNPKVSWLRFCPGFGTMSSAFKQGRPERLFYRSSRRPAADALHPASLLVVNVPQVRFLLAPSRSSASLPCSVQPD